MNRTGEINKWSLFSVTKWLVSANPSNSNIPQRHQKEFYTPEDKQALRLSQAGGTGRPLGKGGRDHLVCQNRHVLRHVAFVRRARGSNLTMLQQQAKRISISNSTAAAVTKRREKHRYSTGCESISCFVDFYLRRSVHGPLCYLCMLACNLVDWWKFSSSHNKQVIKADVNFV